jgi:hypothetical protein
MRQIVVRVFDKKWKVLIEVSILTDDKTRNAKEVIELMLKRWVQENDFKYLIKHFGINQITSYAFVDYKDLRDKIDDKLYTCGKHKKLTKQIHGIRAKLKTALLRKYNFQQKYLDGLDELPEKEQQRKNKIWKEVELLDTELKNLEKQRRESLNHVSKLDELIEQDYKKLNTNAKSFMDAIKILARNIFYLSLQPFKQAYDNYRDDHGLYRNLSQAAGMIDENHENIVIHLIPTMQHPKRIKMILDDIIDQINDSDPTWPDGSNRQIRLKMAANY